MSRDPEEEGPMNATTAEQTEKLSENATQAQEPVRKTPAPKEPTVKDKWNASWERVAFGVAAAAGAGLAAATLIGVGPAALAGAAGYIAYRDLREKRKRAEAGPQH
jgi:hypothetical protein